MRTLLSWEFGYQLLLYHNVFTANTINVLTLTFGSWTMTFSMTFVVRLISIRLRRVGGRIDLQNKQNKLSCRLERIGSMY
jgi:hypothetical protein